MPLLFIQNVTGFIVGKDYEQRGIIKHGAMMINAVSNSAVPHLTLQIGASYEGGQLRHVRPRVTIHGLYSSGRIARPP